MKLTARQKANIVSAYAAGGISYSTLAAKYGVTVNAIGKIILAAKANGDYYQKVDGVKKEAERSMLEYIQSKRGTAQSLIDALLDIPMELIQKSSLRDRMGAIKILTDCITDSGKTENADNRMQFTFKVMDLGAEEKSDAG